MIWYDKGFLGLLVFKYRNYVRSKLKISEGSEEWKLRTEEQELYSLPSLPCPIILFLRLSNIYIILWFFPVLLPSHLIVFTPFLLFLFLFLLCTSPISLNLYLYLYLYLFIRAHGDCRLNYTGVLLRSNDGYCEGKERNRHNHSILRWWTGNVQNRTILFFSHRIYPSDRKERKGKTPCYKVFCVYSTNLIVLLHTYTILAWFFSLSFLWTVL